MVLPKWRIIMAFRKNSSDLAWSNITAQDADEAGCIEVWNDFMRAKAALEEQLLLHAQTSGLASPEDSAKFSYRTIGQGVIGMAIVETKAQRTSGFAGLKRPVRVDNLSDWQRERDAGGYRR